MMHPAPATPATTTRRPFADVSDRNNRINVPTATKMGGSTGTNKAAAPYVPQNSVSESPEPTCRGSDIFTLKYSTCVPSFLHHIGLSHHAASFMAHGINTCGQLHAMPFDHVRPIVGSDEDCQAIITALNTPTPAAIEASLRMSSVPASNATQSMGMTAMSMSPAMTATTAASEPRVLRSRRHDPYAFSCLAAEDEDLANTSSEEAATTVATAEEELSPEPSFAARGMSSSWADAVEEEEREEEAKLQRQQQLQQQHSNVPMRLSESMVRSRLPSFSAASEPPATPMLEPITPSLAENPSLTFTDIIGNLSLDGSMAVPSTPSAMDATPCTCIVHFKYRQTEFAAPFLVRPGQYVMVSGDRGQDLGLVLRVNTDAEKGYVERTGPQGNVLRLAYQKEVDYANGALRGDEMTAAEVCRGKVHRLGLNMEVHYAEFQYDKKKLTFYYESRSRVDFVALLKDLYREFGCRIWMEKVPKTQQQQQEQE
eukprot:PhM_4_TR18870/c0_g1_i2/m.82932